MVYTYVCVDPSVRISPLERLHPLPGRTDFFHLQQRRGELLFLFRDPDSSNMDSEIIVTFIGALLRKESEYTRCAKRYEPLFLLPLNATRTNQFPQKEYTYTRCMYTLSPPL